MDNINLAIDDLRNGLIDIINESGLPIGVVELICKEVYNKVQMQYIAYINSEKMKNIKTANELTEEVKEIIDHDEKELKEVLNGQ